MNSWNFNELTQQDLYDFKSCQRKDGSVYGIPNKSECQTGKEIKKEDLEKLMAQANKGDKKAVETLKKVNEAEKKVKQEENKKKQEAEKKKKEAEAEKKGKKGKGKGKGGGKGKSGGKGKGGGKGKADKEKKGKGGGKGKGKGGGKSDTAKAAARQQSQQQRKGDVRQRQIESARRGAKALQDALSKIKNPKQRERLEKKIADLMTTVAELSMPAGSSGSGEQSQAAPGLGIAERVGQ
jgi:hypothetical protein